MKAPAEISPVAGLAWDVGVNNPTKGGHIAPAVRLDRSGNSAVPPASVPSACEAWEAAATGAGSSAIAQAMPTGLFSTVSMVMGRGLFPAELCEEIHAPEELRFVCSGKSAVPPAKGVVAGGDKDRVESPPSGAERTPGSPSLGGGGTSAGGLASRGRLGAGLMVGAGGSLLAGAGGSLLAGAGAGLLDEAGGSLVPAAASRSLASLAFSAAPDLSPGGAGEGTEFQSSGVGSSGGATSGTNGDDGRCPDSGARSRTTSDGSGVCCITAKGGQGGHSAGQGRQHVG